MPRICIFITTDAVSLIRQGKLMEKITQGNFTLRDMYEQFQNLLKMGAISPARSIPLYRVAGSRSSCAIFLEILFDGFHTHTLNTHASRMLSLSVYRLLAPSILLLSSSASDHSCRSQAR